MAVTQRASRTKIPSQNDPDHNSDPDGKGVGLEGEGDNDSKKATAPVKSRSFDKESARIQYGDKKILVFEELPEWMKQNVWIRTGYRVPMYSYRKCLKSLFYLHNEWVNTWSHLIGFIVFGVFCFTVYYNVLQSYDNSVDWLDFTVFYCFLGGAIICLGFSAFYHCFTCHSPQVAATWNRCDYAGIVTLIVGSFYPSIYYGFYCHPNLQITYITGISILGFLTGAAAVMQKFRTPEYRWIRTSLFLSLGLSAIIPVIHGLTIYNLAAALDSMSLGYMVTMGAMYVFGALIYGWRIPERWYPGTFDYFGGSHQIFHLFVVGAALVHYVGVVKVMRFWHEGKGVEYCAHT